MRPDADFADVARHHSDSYTATTGGDMGLREYGYHMKPPFAKAAFALETDEISRPVKTPEGYHVIKADGPVYPAGILPLEALEDRIRDDLASRKKRDATAALKKRLLAKYAAKIRLNGTFGAA
jgi:peptidyl-prolyl cis-trans isomerase C